MSFIISYLFLGLNPNSEIRSAKSIAEIGRWKQVDPKMEEQMNWLTYVSMNNNPISNVDTLGDIVNVHYLNIRIRGRK